jgi:hypothetical protein
MFPIIRTLTVLLLLPVSLFAVEIPVANPSFEDDVLCDGCFITSGVSGWSVSLGGVTAC